MATPEKIYPHLFNIDLTNSKIIYWLFKLRGLPTPVVLTTIALEKMCFVKLEEIENREIVFGLIGQFWKITGELQTFKPEEFYHFNNNGFAKAIWNFEVTAINENISELRTETRVLCTDKRSKRRFKFYWNIIGPFSGVIRKEILRAIKLKVENKV